MRLFKFLLSLAFTLSLIYLLNNRWSIGNTPVPPLGKFLDPFHGFWQNSESEPDMAQELKIKGLKAPVTVVYDSLLIPHIFAENDEDLYMAQGYITAQLRLWQMEFQTHAIAGRLTEIIGAGPDNAVLNYCRGQRRQGMLSSAKAMLVEIEKDPLAKLIVDNYTAGVNEYIRELSYAQLPLEYKLMGYEPEVWTPLKCILMQKSMAQTLNSGDKDLEISNALALFGPEVVELLYPDREAVSDPIIDKKGKWNFKPVTIPDSIESVLPPALVKVDRVNEQDPTTGSNNWAVSGSKTATGSPILCNDPHLTISIPSLWFAIQLNAPGINCMGVSIAGLPEVIIGFNDSVAWGFTNAQRDLVDWYKIQFENSKKEKYMLDGQWTSTRKVVEEFKIRGEESYYDTVVYTQWGPVMYDETFHGDNELSNYSYRWLSHDPSFEVDAIYKLNRARNFDDYMKAMDQFSVPGQNFAFASTSGDIAMRIQGKYPVRRKFEGKFLLDGSKSQNGWQGFIPNDQNPFVKNPERGFVSSANQYPTDSLYPYYITATSFDAYRNRRINDVLRRDTSITVNDMMKLQNDNYNLKASESLPFFLSQLDTTKLTLEERKAYQVLKSWDFVNDINSEGASYYEAWWDQLMPLAWDEMKNPDTSLKYPTTWTTIHLIKTQPTLSFFDILDTPERETATEVLRKSFSQSVKDIDAWKSSHTTDKVRWADYKDTYIQHLARIAQLSYHVQVGGNHDIVNATSKTHGPSWRMIVSLEKGNVQAYAIYPGGQSGNPGSIYYNNLLDHWATGKYFNLVFMKNAEDQNTRIMSTTQITPSK